MRGSWASDEQELPRPVPPKTEGQGQGTLGHLENQKRCDRSLCTAPPKLSAQHGLAPRPLLAKNARNGAPAAGENPSLSLVIRITAGLFLYFHTEQ